jgi:hypothetical protein
MLRTFSNFHLRDGLPLVHGNKPGSFPFSTAQIDHKFVAIIAERCQDLFQARD